MRLACAWPLLIGLATLAALTAHANPLGASASIKIPRRAVRAPRIMSKYYRAILELLVARGFAAPRAPVRVNKIAKIAIGCLLLIAFIVTIAAILGVGGAGVAISPVGIVWFAVAVIVSVVVLYVINLIVDWLSRAVR